MSSKKINPKPMETEDQKKNRETTERIAENLSALADSVKKLINGPLNRKTLLVLLANSSGLKQMQVDSVLTALENLKRNHLN